MVEGPIMYKNEFIITENNVRFEHYKVKVIYCVYCILKFDLFFSTKVIYAYYAVTKIQISQAILDCS